MNRYLGRIVEIPRGESFGFIGLRTVSVADGTAHDLQTKLDLFVHQHDCDTDLVIGKMIQFEVEQDERRQGGLRAKQVCEHIEVELLPAFGELVPGFAGSLMRSADPERDLRLQALFAKMKNVPEALVLKVAENDPLPTANRDENRMPTYVEALGILRAMLIRIFPALGEFQANFDILNANDEQLDAAVEEVMVGYREMGMIDMVTSLEHDIASFRSMRGTLKFLLEKDLVRSQTIIPLENLVDLFLACPVWYTYTDADESRTASETWQNDDPYVPDQVMFICDLIKTQRWYDLFQLWNRRVRPLAMYKGEQIPPSIMRMIRSAREHFDMIVIATCYHDEAGKEWRNPEWQRGIDPYVLGFKKGLPYFVVLGRYSDTGLFPLFDQLVGDTMQFLTQNMRLLDTWTAQPYWYRGQEDKTSIFARKVLPEFVDHLLKAFEAGIVFDWVRGKAELPQN
jgi:hypothetical protein